MLHEAEYLHYMFLLQHINGLGSDIRTRAAYASLQQTTGVEEAAGR